MKNVFFISLLFLIGCDSVQSETENKYNYFNQDLNLRCTKFLEINIRDVAVCDAWKIDKNDIDSIISNSQKYQKNFVGAASFLIPLEFNLKRVIELGRKDNDKVYTLYPNGFIIEALNKNFDFEYKDSQINQSYVCNNKECKRFFLWSFVDEEIAEQMKQDSFDENDFLHPEDVSYNIVKNKINIQDKFLIKNSEIKVNYKECWIEGEKCNYIIYNDFLYLYDVYYDFVQKINLKNK